MTALQATPDTRTNGEVIRFLFGMAGRKAIAQEYPLVGRSIAFSRHLLNYAFPEKTLHTTGFVACGKPRRTPGEVTQAVRELVAGPERSLYGFRQFLFDVCSNPVAQQAVREGIPLAIEDLISQTATNQRLDSRLPKNGEIMHGVLCVLGKWDTLAPVAYASMVNEKSFARLVGALSGSNDISERPWAGRLLSHAAQTNEHLARAVPEEVRASAVRSLHAFDDYQRKLDAENLPYVRERIGARSIYKQTFSEWESEIFARRNAGYAEGTKLEKLLTEKGITYAAPAGLEKPVPAANPEPVQRPSTAASVPKAGNPAPGG